VVNWWSKFFPIMRSDRLGYIPEKVFGGEIVKRRDEDYRMNGLFKKVYSTGAIG